MQDFKYMPPTSDGAAFAVEDGWSEKEAKRGYAIFDYDGTGLLELSRIDDAYIGTKREWVTDGACAKEAMRAGVCKIIPTRELPKQMPEDMKLHQWLDTPENRAALKDWCEEWP